MKAKRFVHIPPNPPPTPPLPPSALPPPSGPPAGPQPTEPGSNLPIRWGKPRSFWAILGLSIITCGIYYIVYHFLVANELRKTVGWGENESFKPVTYMWLYGAYLGLSIIIAPMLGVAMAFGVMTNPDKLQNMLNMAEGPLQALSLVINVFTIAAEFYIAYYFLKLNESAGPKLGAPVKSATRALVIYSFIVGLSLILTFAGLALDVGPEFLEDISSGGADWTQFLAIIGFYAFVVFLLIGVALFFLWEQTELVNYVWEKGRFAAPPGYASPAPTTPLAAGYTPNPAPGPRTAPGPPTAPTRRTAPDQPSKRPDAENPTTGSGPQTPPPPPVSD